MIENPQPIWLALLILAFPGIVLAARGINNVIFPTDDRSPTTAAAIVIVLALLPTHILSLIFGSLNIGLPISWILVGCAGYISGARRWAQVPKIESESFGWHKVVLAILVTLPILLPTFLLNIWDEVLFGGHLSIIADLQNGRYPPRYLYEPNLPLHYHYGFDLAAAIITAVLRVRGDQAIDILTLVLWPCLFLLLWRCGSYLAGKKAGLFVALAVCFCGNFPLLCTEDGYSTGSLQSIVAWRMMGFCTVGKAVINPPFVSYYFQHPWGIGVLIFCLVVLQRAALSRIRYPIIGLIALGCSLALLSLLQVVLFVCLICALGASEFWKVIRHRDTMAAYVIGTVLAAFLAAKFMGGFFAGGNYPPGGGLLGSAFTFREFSSFQDVADQLRWNIASFGLLLLVGIIGLYSVPRERLFLITLATVPFLILNIFQYKYTWDIVKFGTVTFIALSIGAGLVFANFWHRAIGPMRKAWIGLIALIVGGQGLAFLALATLLIRNPMIVPYFSSSYPIAPDEGSAISFLRTHIGASEMVFRTAERSKPYAVWGGIPTQNSYYSEGTTNGRSINNDQYGLGEEKLKARINLEIVSDDWLTRLYEENIRWIVSGPDDVNINAFIDQAILTNAVIPVVEFGNIRIVKITPVQK